MTTKTVTLPLPSSGFYFQPNTITIIISLSLLSDTHRVCMNTDVENSFIVFNREDGTYMQYTQCPMSNLYTYDVGVGKEESEVLLHSTVEGEK